MNMPLALFTGWDNEDDDSFSAVGWTNYPDDGSIDDPAELVSDLVVSIQVVEEIPSVLGDGVSQSPSQEEDLHNDLPRFP
jgi:hypothetical protein